MNKDGSKIFWLRFKSYIYAFYYGMLNYEFESFIWEAWIKILLELSFTSALSFLSFFTADSLVVY